MPASVSGRCVSPEPIVIDGRLTEPAWALAEVGADFYQQEPAEGALTSERSEIRFLYDEDALYFAGTFAESDVRGPSTPAAFRLTL